MRANALRCSMLLTMAVLLLAASASAEIFTVTLTNGNTFTTAYKPQDASYDPGKYVLLTAPGNIISLDKADVAEITSETESRGFGTIINSTTIAIGPAPNDAPSPDQVVAAQDAAANRRPLINVPQPRNFTTQQFAEPNQGGGGLPVTFGALPY